MQIKIKSKDRNFNLWLPTSLFLNPLGIVICTKVINGNFTNSLFSKATGHKVSYSKMRRLFKVIRKSRRILQGQPIVSAKSAGGEVVEIWI